MIKRPPEEYINTTEEITASDLIYANMSEYSKYMVASKYPHCIDGLKLGQRRALWIIKDYDNPIMENKFIGLINEYHHHGDLAIADTVKRMMRDTEYGVTLIDTEGNKGGYSAREGAAARYLQVFQSSFTRNVFFDSSCHKKTIPMMAREDYSGWEPMYLIPRVPTALLFPQLTVGIGFKTLTLPLRLESVCELVKVYATYMQEHNDLQRTSFNYRGLEEHFLPEFPTYCYLRNEEELLENYRQGNFSASCQLEGFLDVYPNKYVLKTIPYGKPIQDVTESRSQGRDSIIKEALKTRSHWLSQACSSFTDRLNNTKMAEFSVTLKRNYHPMEWLNEFKKLVGLHGRYTPIMNYGTQNFSLKLFDPIQLLQVWYKERYNSLLGGIKYKQIDCILDISIQKAILHISDYPDEVFKIIRSHHTREDRERGLCERFDLSRSQAQALVKSEIGNLGPEVKPEIEKKIEDLERLANTYTDQLDKVHETIYNDAVFISKKYGKPRRTRRDKFIGYINLRKVQGIIQFESIDELASLLNDFHNEDKLTITTYIGKGTIKKLIVKGKPVKETWTPSKQTNGDGILEYHPEMTCTVRITDGTVSTVADIRTMENMDNVKNKAGIFHTTPKFLSLNSYGRFKTMEYTQLSLRKNLNSLGSKTTDIVGVIPLISTWKEVFIIHSNSLHKNTVRIDRINIWKPSPIQLIPGGKTIVIGVIPAIVDTPQILFLPKHFSHVTGFIMFENINEFMEGIKTKVITLNNKFPRHKAMKQIYLVK
jgi:DNA gyrase/topoisomerase IV subunit A